MQKNLLPEKSKKKNNNVKKIGANLALIFDSRNKQIVTLKNRDVIVKKVDLSDKPAKKMFIIDAVELGATKYLLADALNISRQTIHNYIESKKKIWHRRPVRGIQSQNGQQPCRTTENDAKWTYGG